MKSLIDKIGAGEFFGRFNASRYINSRYFNRIALSAIFSSYLSLSCSSSTGSYYRDINRSLENSPQTNNVVSVEPTTPSLDNYQLDSPQPEYNRPYNGRRNDTISLEGIADEGLRRDVRRRLNGTNIHEFRRITRRIERFSSIIESYSEAYNIDGKLLAGVTYHESGGNPKAKSRKGAMGLMQLTRGAVRDVTGRKHTSEEIMNPENNIEFGTSYLSILINRFNGNVGLGLAAYNLGPTRLDGVLNRLLRTKNIKPEDADWDDIKYMLPRETREYVPGVLSKILKMEEEAIVENYATGESKERSYVN